MNTLHDAKSARSAGISFSSNVNPILSIFQRRLVAKMMEPKLLEVDLLHNKASIRAWPKELKSAIG